MEALAAALLREQEGRGESSRNPKAPRDTQLIESGREDGLRIARRMLREALADVDTATARAAEIANERRANVQGDCRIPYDEPGYADGTIAWSEHLESLAWFGRNSDAQPTPQGVHDRGGFGYVELTMLLGHEPTTWKVRT